MAKVAIIGAGSIVFCKTLILDILGTPGLEDTEFALMAPSTTRTSQVETFINRVIKENGLPAKVWVTTDRREALKGADYVIATFQVGGVERVRGGLQDAAQARRRSVHRRHAGAGRHLPRPAQHPRDDRHGATTWRSCARMRLLLNYVNPMAMICWALGTTGVQFVGLCHGVQTTLDLISGYVGVPKDRDRLPVRRHQPHGLVPEDWSTRARISTRCCAAASSSPSTTSTRRCAARSCATSATS